MQCMRDWMAYLLLQFSMVGEKTLHDFIFGGQLLPQLPDNALRLTEHDLLDDMMVGGVVEEEVVHDRPARCNTVGEWTAWLTSAQVQASQKLKPEFLFQVHFNLFPQT